MIREIYPVHGLEDSILNDAISSQFYLYIQQNLNKNLSKLFIRYQWADSKMYTIYMTYAKTKGI